MTPRTMIAVGPYDILWVAVDSKSRGRFEEPVRFRIRHHEIRTGKFIIDWGEETGICKRVSINQTLLGDWQARIIEEVENIQIF